MKETKYCFACKVTKPVTAFTWWVAAGKIKRHSYCKPCRSQMNLPQAKRWNREHREQYLARMHAYAHRSRRRARGLPITHSLCTASQTQGDSNA